VVIYFDSCIKQENIRKNKLIGEVIMEIFIGMLILAVVVFFSYEAYLSASI